MTSEAKNLVLPIGAAITLIVVIIGGAIAYGALRNQVVRNTDDLRILQTDFRDAPTRREFDEVKRSIDTLAGKIDKILDRLSIK